MRPLGLQDTSLAVDDGTLGADGKSNVGRDPAASASHASILLEGTEEDLEVEEFIVETDHDPTAAPLQNNFVDDDDDDDDGDDVDSNPQVCEVFGCSVSLPAFSACIT
jgi:hypothetical protein